MMSFFSFFQNAFARSYENPNAGPSMDGDGNEEMRTAALRCGTYYGSALKSIYILGVINPLRL